MRTLPLICAAATLWVSGASAGEYDGIYRQSADADCTLVGQDGGALKIADSVFSGVDSQCTMSRPVKVRDMNATLFDMVCSGEGTNWVERALFMTAVDGGLIMAWNGYAFKYDRCTEADIVDSALDAADNVASPVD